MCGRGRWVRLYFTLPIRGDTFTCLPGLSGHVPPMIVRKTVSGIRVEKVASVMEPLNSVKVAEIVQL